MRLFTGLELPATLTWDLASLQGGLPGARWIDPGDFHITLAFIGDVSPSTARELAEQLRRLRKPALSLRLVGLDVFGSRKPSSIQAKVSSEPALMALQAAHVSLLRRLGVAVEKRRYQPHVTIGRVSNCRPVDIARFMGRTGGVFTPPFPATRFILYSARDSVGGGPYLTEETYPLTEPKMHEAETA